MRGAVRMEAVRTTAGQRGLGEPSTRRAPAIARRAKVGGGAGSCTRVRKYIPAGIYDAYPLLKCRSRRKETARAAGNQPRKISLLSSGTAEVSQPAEMTSVPLPQADEDGRSQVFTLRERAAYPQLGCFHLLTRLMVLGTHPTEPYSRRIWFAPFSPLLYDRPQAGH